MRVARLQALVGPAGVAAIQGAFLLVLGVGGARVAAGAITVGDLVAFMLFLFFLVHAAGSGAARVHPAADRPGRAAAHPGDPGAARRRTTATGRAVAAIGDAAAAARPSTFDGRDVRLSGRPSRCVRDVSFAVPRGTRTALVGPSGAGKSTLLALIERFYEVDRRRPSGSTASTCGTCPGTRCAPSSATSSRRRRCWPARCATTCC